MDLTKIKAKLSEDEFKELSEHVTDLSGQRDAARKESIDGRQSLKKRVHDLESIQEKLFDRLGISEAAEIDDLPDAKGQAEAVKQYEAKFKKLEKQLQDTTQERDGLHAKHRNAARDAAISGALAPEALGGQRLIDNDLVAAHLRSGADWDGENLVYRGADGVPIGLKDAVAALVKAKPHLLQPVGNGNGSNFQAREGQGKTINVKEFDALPGKKQAELISAGVVPVE